MSEIPNGAGYQAEYAGRFKLIVRQYSGCVSVSVMDRDKGPSKGFGPAPRTRWKKRRTWRLARRSASSVPALRLRRRSGHTSIHRGP